MVTTNTVFLAGEVTTHADVDVDSLVREVVKDIGYDFNGFDYNNLTISRHIHRQSPDIAMGVDTFGTGNDAELTEYVRQKYDFKPKAIIEMLGLRNPEGWCYRGTARNGHFTNRSFPWEEIEK